MTEGVAATERPPYAGEIEGVAATERPPYGGGTEGVAATERPPYGGDAERRSDGPSGGEEVAMRWIRRSPEKDVRIDAVLLVAVKAVFGDGNPIQPLWGGAFFRALSQRCGIPEQYLSDRAQRLGLWGGLDSVEAELDGKWLAGGGVAGVGCRVPVAGCRPGRGGEGATALPEV